MTVREVLDAAREAALEIRRLEEQIEIRRQAIGVQGHNSFEVHPKTGILDPMRHVVEYLDWSENIADTDGLNEPIYDAYEIMHGIERVSDSLSVELATRYYLQAESWPSIARDLGEVRHIEALADLDRSEQIRILIKAMEEAVAEWDRIGIAHLKEMGR